MIDENILYDQIGDMFTDEQMENNDVYICVVDGNISVHIYEKEGMGE